MLLLLLAWMTVISDAKIEIIYDGTVDGISIFRCLWSSGPGYIQIPQVVSGSWHKFCYDNDHEITLATFSLTDFIVQHYSVNGEVWGNINKPRGTVTSVVKFNIDCRGMIICVIEKEEASLILSSRLYVNASISYHTSNTDVLLRCSVQHLCGFFTIQWLFAGKFLTSKTFGVTEDITYNMSSIYSKLLTWEGGVLRLNGSGPWSMSYDCFVCEISTCNITEVVTLHDPRWLRETITDLSPVYGGVVLHGSRKMLLIYSMLYYKSFI